MEASDLATGDWREWRRLRALHLKQRGWYQRDIAEALGVREEAVSRWLARARDGGPQALFARPAPGRFLSRSPPRGSARLTYSRSPGQRIPGRQVRAEHPQPDKGQQNE